MMQRNIFGQRIHSLLQLFCMIAQGVTVTDVFIGNCLQFVNLVMMTVRGISITSILLLKDKYPTTST